MKVLLSWDTEDAEEFDSWKQRARIQEAMSDINQGGDAVMRETIAEESGSEVRTRNVAELTPKKCYFGAKKIIFELKVLFSGVEV